MISFTLFVKILFYFCLPLPLAEGAHSHFPPLGEDPTPFLEALPGNSGLLETEIFPYIPTLTSKFYMEQFLDSCAKGDVDTLRKRFLDVFLAEPQPATSPPTQPFEEPTSSEATPLLTLGEVEKKPARCRRVNSAVVRCLEAAEREDRRAENRDDPEFSSKSSSSAPPMMPSSGISSEQHSSPLSSSGTNAVVHLYMQSFFLRRRRLLQQGIIDQQATFQSLTIPSRISDLSDQKPHSDSRFSRVFALIFRAVQSVSLGGFLRYLLVRLQKASLISLLKSNLVPKWLLLSLPNTRTLARSSTTLFVTSWTLSGRN